MDAMGAVTFGLALLGGVLGVVNTWKSVDKDRVKLIVRPAHAIPYGAAEERHPQVQFSIEVINASTFPVTVAEIGFLLKGTKARGVVIQPVTLDGKGSTPRRLEAREAISFYMEKPGRGKERLAGKAYARTACGRTFTGTSRALRQVRAEQAKGAAGRA